MFRRRARFTRRPQPKHWFRGAGVEVISASANTNITLMSPTAYAGNTLISPSGVTMARVILNAVFTPTVVGALDVSSVLWGLSVLDVNQTGAFSITSSNLTDERFLRSGAWGATVPASSLFGSTDYGHNLSEDTKQRVKLRDQELRFTTTESGGVTWTMSYTVSVLLIGDTT